MVEENLVQANKCHHIAGVNLHTDIMGPVGQEDPLELMVATQILHMEGLAMPHPALIQDTLDLAGNSLMVLGNKAVEGGRQAVQGPIHLHRVV